MSVNHSNSQKTLASGKAAETASAAPEMEKIVFLLGTWVAADKYEKTTFNPEGGEGSGNYKTILGPGGFSFLTDYRYQAPHGQSGGHQILTWDAKAGPQQTSVSGGP